MDSDLSPQDKKDLDKFIKFFALKTVQVIVQARLGEKICTRSSSSPTGSDWFNLAIKDIPEVTHEAKKALAGQLPGIGRSMCVEISLKTSEGDSMELETWCLEMNEKIYFGEVQLTGLGEGLNAELNFKPVAFVLKDKCYFRRTAVEDEGVTYPGVEDSQEVCTTSFSTSPPSQVTTACLDLPFAAFAPKNFDMEENDLMVNPPDSPVVESPLQGSLHSDDSTGSSGPLQDDFVMVDFKPAFSKDDLLPIDLGTFYREFQNPPQLSSLSIDVSAQSMAEDLDTLPVKLALYEQKIDEFDAFVETLQ
ncbi:UNVERIFIED_CONTAM: hypothetical protein FKN15_032264 [Acipenser sinensis]